jgi:hypothetical protein
MKKCTCGKNEGCTDKCNRGLNYWEIAIEEARTIPPSSRDKTLDWVLARVHELEITPSDLVVYR